MEQKNRYGDFYKDYFNFLFLNDRVNEKLKALDRFRVVNFSFPIRSVKIEKALVYLE